MDVCLPRGIYQLGEVWRGIARRCPIIESLADDGKRAKTRRVARWTLVRARREIFINWGSAEGEGDGSAPRFQAMRIPQNGRFA